MNWLISKIINRVIDIEKFLVAALVIRSQISHSSLCPVVMVGFNSDLSDLVHQVREKKKTFGQCGVALKPQAAKIHL